MTVAVAGCRITPEAAHLLIMVDVGANETPRWHPSGRWPVAVSSSELGLLDAITDADVPDHPDFSGRLPPVDTSISPAALDEALGGGLRDGPFGGVADLAWPPQEPGAELRAWRVSLVSP